MAEPTTTAAGAAAAGVTALFMALLGIEPQALVWGLVGAVFGLSFAPQSGRVRAALVFIAVAFAAALLGTWAAEFWHAGSRIARNGWAMALAAAFHPLLAAFVQAVPAALQALVRSRTGSNSEGGQ